MDFLHTGSRLVLSCLPSGRCGWTQENAAGHLRWVKGTPASGTMSHRKSRGRQKPSIRMLGGQACSWKGEALWMCFFLGRVTLCIHAMKDAEPPGIHNPASLRAYSSLKAVRALPSLGGVLCYFIWWKRRGSRVEGSTCVSGDALGWLWEAPWTLGLSSSGSCWDWRVWWWTSRVLPTSEILTRCSPGNQVFLEKLKEFRSRLPRGNPHASPDAPAAPHPRSHPRAFHGPRIAEGRQDRRWSSQPRMVTSAHPLKMSSAAGIQHFKNSMNFTLSKNIIPASQLNKTSLPMMSQMHFASMAPHTWETELCLQWIYLW